jgi:hypothetical protein
LALLRDPEKIRVFAVKTPKFQNPYFLKSPLSSAYTIQFFPYSLIFHLVIYSFYFYDFTIIKIFNAFAMRQHFVAAQKNVHLQKF